MKRHNLSVTGMIYGLLSLLCFAGIFWLTCVRAGEVPKRDDVRIVLFGDSILGDCRDETSVSGQLQSLLGVPVYNGALGGTSFGRLDEEMRLGYTKDTLNMSALSTAIRADDFSIQISTRIRENATDYFPETIEGLSEIDFGAVEVVIIEHCVNDYHGGSRLVNEEDPYDEYTFTGAIRSTVRNLQESYPDLRIILMTSTYSWYTNRNLTCEEYNPGGGMLELYVDTEIQLARELGIEIIDVYHDFYPHESWEDWQIYTRDGLHPNEAGRLLLAQTLADYLKTHPHQG